MAKNLLWMRKLLQKTHVLPELTKVVQANRPAEMTVNKDFCCTTIFDSGMEWNVIGSPAWSIRKLYKRPLNMPAVASNMSSVAMKTCDTVTAVQNSWKLDCVAKRHGGSQCLWLPDWTK
eukprot:2557989-Ditylum_brightwellii.AAC.1